MKFNTDQKPVLYCGSANTILQVQMGEFLSDLEAKYLMEKAGDAD